MADETDNTKPRRKRGERNEITLNLVAMLDMAFNILIFFILTANFAAGEGVLTAKLPEPPDPEILLTKAREIPKNPIVINVSSAGSGGYNLNIEGSVASTRDFTELQSQLSQMQSDPAHGRAGAYKSDNPVVIRSDGGVRWQHVVNAFNAAISARYSDISFAASRDPVSRGGLASPVVVTVADAGDGNGYSIVEVSH
ncbi:MAG: biopolymer transporter ExbD [Planctomycetes bacterium]|nr:biopolymer transporter ExbD [Planctomycetota bacterium]